MGGGAAGALGGVTGGDTGISSCFRARRNPKMTKTRSTTAMRIAAMRAIGDCRVKENLWDAVAGTPNGSWTSTRKTKSVATMSLVVHVTEVTPVRSTTSGI